MPMSSGRCSVRFAYRLGEIFSAGCMLFFGLTLCYISVYSTLDRPITMKHNSRTEECLAGIASAERSSDRWIAPFIRVESFLVTMDEVYASIQASGGSMLVQVTRGALRRQFDSLSADIEKDLSSYPSSTGASSMSSRQFDGIDTDPHSECDPH